MSEAATDDPVNAETPDRTRHRAFARIRDWIAASDPAYSRLRLASRAILSMISSGLVLGAITLVHPLPIAAYGLAVIISFIGTLAVRDTTASGQMLTRLCAGLSGLASVFLASFLAPVPVIADIAFLVVIFLCVYVRSFGPRGFAAGMLAFIAYFMGDYLHPQPGQIGWLALAVAISLLISHTVCTMILVDRPERDFRRALTTIDRRINLILRELRHGAGQPADKAMRKRLARHLAALHTIVLMAEGFIPQSRTGGLAAEGAASDLAVALFDLQLVTERLVAMTTRAMPPEKLASAVLCDDDRTVTEETGALKRAPEGEETAVRRLLVRVHRSRRRLAATLGPRPSPAFRQDRDTGAAKGASAGGNGDDYADEDKASDWVPPALQLPIQVTLACAIAMGSGLFVSSTRWYWAVITAFIVFNNTRSRADTAVKALQRSAGTLGGLFAGTVVATLLQGHTVGSVAGILVLFFFAFYFIQTSYAIMIFLITIAIALLYGLMGQFTPQVLVLRLEETVIGALAGVLVAFFVFPKRASTEVSTALDAYFTALSALVGAVDRSVRDGKTSENLLALSRALDRAFADLATTARPLGGPWTAVTRFGHVRERLLFLAACAHWSRTLAKALSEDPSLSDTQSAQIAGTCDRIERRLTRARSATRRFFLTPVGPKDENDTDDPRWHVAIREDGDPILAIQMMATLFDRAVSGDRRAQD